MNPVNADVVALIMAVREHDLPRPDDIWELDASAPNGYVLLPGGSTAAVAAIVLVARLVSDNIGGWWDEPILYQKLMIWTILLEVMGLAATCGPLAFHFDPPIGGILYWWQNDTLRVPPYPNHVPFTKGNRRTPWDTGLYKLIVFWLMALAVEPMVAIGSQAQDASRGRLNGSAIRIVVAVGVAAGIALGVYRILVGGPFHYYVMASYGVVVVLVFLAPKYIVALAFDLGGVTTSEVTVPLVTALGIGLATALEGRDALMDGFGLIAFASIFPIISVLVYAMVQERLPLRRKDLAAHVRAIHRARQASGRSRAGRGAHAQAQLHRHRAHPARAAA